MGVTLSFLENLPGILPSFYRRGANYRRNIHGYITLTLLAVACQTMPHELTRTDSADMVHCKRKGDMLDGREMSASGKFFQEGLNLRFRHLPGTAFRRSSLAVTEPGSLGYTAIGKRCMGD